MKKFAPYCQTIILWSRFFRPFDRNLDPIYSLRNLREAISVPENKSDPHFWPHGWDERAAAAGSRKETTCTLLYVHVTTYLFVQLVGRAGSRVERFLIIVLVSVVVVVVRPQFHVTEHTISHWSQDQADSGHTARPQ